MLLLQEAAANNGSFSILMLVALIAIFYFFMIRPQNKRQKEIRKFREGIQKGQKVVTAGGIHGTVKEIADTYFILEIADGVKIRVDKGSVYPDASTASEAQQQTQQ